LVATDNTWAFGAFKGIVLNDFTFWALQTFRFANIIALSNSLFSQVVTSWATWNFSWNANNAFKSAFVNCGSLFFAVTAFDWHNWARSFFLNDFPFAWTTQTIFVFGQSGESFHNEFFANRVVFRNVEVDWAMSVVFNIRNLTWLAVSTIVFATDLFGFEESRATISS